MTDNRRYHAVFVHNGNGMSERRSALHLRAEPLQRFMAEDDFLRTIPDTDKDLFQGPEELLVEQRLPTAFLRQLIQKDVVTVVRIER